MSGGLRFQHVSTGNSHSCGLTLDNRLYCWGFNFDGELGDGTGYPENVRRLTPVLVTGGRTFRQVRAGYSFTCALTTSNEAFCWGYNVFGQLGDGTRTTRYAPVRVKGGQKWRQLNAGTDHVCGVTTADRAFCWGMNFWGQFGDGTQNVPGKPVPVAGGLRFRQVSAGGAHSCGVTTSNRAYCWGRAEDGVLGNGSGDPPPLSIWSPVAVATSVRFDYVMAGDDHTCGVALSDGVLLGPEFFGRSRERNHRRSTVDSCSRARRAPVCSAESREVGNGSAYGGGRGLPLGDRGR